MKRILIALMMSCTLAYASEATDAQKMLATWKHNFHLETLATPVHIVTKDELAKKSIELMGTDQTLAVSELKDGTLEMWILKRDQFTPGNDVGRYKYDGKRYQREALIHELLHMVWEYSPSEEAGVYMIAHLLAR